MEGGSDGIREGLFHAVLNINIQNNLGQASILLAALYVTHACVKY